MAQASAERVSEPALTRFAQRLRDERAVTRVLWYGHRALGCRVPNQDYEFIIVSPEFAGREAWERQHGLREIFWEMVEKAPTDLTCLTPAEFEQAQKRISFVASVLPEAIDLLPAEPAASPS